MKVTQKTIAQKLGLSVQAVSLALRNHPSISEATRKKVQECAKELGYQVNPLVAALMSSRGKAHASNGVTSLAYITFCNHLRSTSSPVRKEMYKGVCIRAKELGFRVEEFCLADKKLSAERLSQILLSRGVQAMILAPPPNSSTSLALDFSPFAVAALGYNLADPKVHRVTSEMYDIFYELLKNLHQKGYQRPALIMNPKTDANLHWRLGSLFEYVSRHRFKLEDPLLLYEEKQLNSQKTLKWIQLKNPDVLISFFPDLRKMVVDAGMGIPEKLGYVSLCSDPLEDETAIIRSGVNIGMAAVDLVTAHLYRNDRGIPDFPKNMQVSGHFRKGTTVRCQG